MIGHDRCRFEALIQSYDLYSSEQFSKIKPLKNLLEENTAYRLGDEALNNTSASAFNTKGGGGEAIMMAPALVEAKATTKK